MCIYTHIYMYTHTHTHIYVYTHTLLPFTKLFEVSSIVIICGELHEVTWRQIMYKW